MSKMIVVGHADVARGLISAVAAITGRDDVFVAVSNAGLGPAEIQRKLIEAVAETGARVIFTDLPMGSCSTAALRLSRERPDVLIVTGVNLPMLLYAATHDTDDPATLAEAALERARQAIRVIPGVPRPAGAEQAGAD
ncbi:MAG: hypothetical protein ABJD07_16425 [Gemmatimonadaceae bacterium]